MKKLSFLLFFIYFVQQTVVAKTAVNIYVYHLKPPFITNLEKQEGLYFDFSAYLNTQTHQYYFETIYVPKKRIEHMLTHKTLDGILLGVNPGWFNDKNEDKYLWTENWLSDKDYVISLKENPVNYQSPDSLEGKILGGVRGFYYHGINEKVTENKITRIDSVGEYELLKMLLLKRFDAAIISQSTFNYLTYHHKLPNQFYIAEIPHDSYQRQLLVLKNQPELFEFINSVISDLHSSKEWQTTLNKYYF